jgi:hypothetical protein
MPSGFNMADDLRGIAYLLSSPVRALSVPDIVLRIVESIAADSSGVTQYEDLFDDPTCRTLYRLATVSRVFSEPVLDLLWRRTTPWRLAVLMPPHMVRIDSSTRNALSFQSCPVVERCYLLVSLAIRSVFACESYLMETANSGLRPMTPGSRPRPHWRPGASFSTRAA